MAKNRSLKRKVNTGHLPLWKTFRLLRDEWLVDTNTHLVFDADGLAPTARAVAEAAEEEHGGRYTARQIKELERKLWAASKPLTPKDLLEKHGSGGFIGFHGNLMLSYPLQDLDPSESLRHMTLYFECPEVTSDSSASLEVWGQQSANLFVGCAVPKPEPLHQPVYHYEWSTQQHARFPEVVQRDVALFAQCRTRDAHRAIESIYGGPAAVFMRMAAGLYRKHGGAKFCVGPRMQRVLLSTDLPDEVASDVPLPYPSFYVALPGGRWWLHEPRTGRHAVRGAYVFSGEVPGVEKSLMILLWGSENENSLYCGDDAVCWDVLHSDLPLSGGLDPQHKLGANHDTYSEIAHTILGLCYYLSTTNPQVSKHETRSRKRRGRHVIPTPLDDISYTVTWIAKRYEDAKVEDAPRPSSAPEGDVYGMRQHWVRGHFHNYWTGPLKGERVLIRKFVAPHLRGDAARGVVIRDSYQFEADR